MQPHIGNRQPQRARRQGSNHCIQAKTALLSDDNPIISVSVAYWLLCHSMPLPRPTVACVCCHFSAASALLYLYTNKAGFLD